MTPVQIRSIRKSYEKSRPVLEDVSLDIGAGEVFFLLGPSGCGKTTLLRIIAGFLEPDAGSVAFGGEDVTGLPPEKRDIGMVFQNYALWPHLDVRGNISFGLDMRGIPTTEKIRRIDEVLELVELSGYGARRIGELSGGQQQRVALARAIVVKPRVLLLDEPLSNLDARLRLSMRAEIRRVCKGAGLTAIYVTHDQGEALSTADRIALIQDGRVAQVGSPRELYERPKNREVAEFVGEANFYSGRAVDAKTVECDLGMLRCETDAKPGAPVEICIRPEKIRLRSQVPGGNEIAAVLREGSFLGPTGSWFASCGSTLVHIQESAPEERRAGEALTLYIDPRDVIVFEKK